MKGDLKNAPEPQPCKFDAELIEMVNGMRREVEQLKTKVRALEDEVSYMKTPF